ncbi:MAG: methyltransferase domain-containing protein [Desulfarculus sp.]|nr:methyltransferase domain-containing protein [Desulfarculus sp.]
MLKDLAKRALGLGSKPSRLFTDFASDQEFVEALYRVILNRKSDPGGLNHHVERLGKGEVARHELLRDFVRSEECRYTCGVKYEPHEVLLDYTPVLDPAPFAPYVRDQPYQGALLCELVNPRKWLDQGWHDTLKDMQALSLRLDDIHRKHYEYVQTAYGLRLLGALHPGASVLGVGAGHERILYWLANNAARVVGTDLYEGNWASDNAQEGDPDVIENPAKYAPFPYRQEALSFQRMDGRKLEFDDHSFDVVYSLSSIEHFGGHEGSAQSMAEIGRVLKPGGCAAIATELILNDASDDEFFSLADLVKFVVAPSGLKLVQMPTLELPKAVLERPLDLPQERYFRPHLVLAERGLVYTSVMLFLVKE